LSKVLVLPPPLRGMVGEGGSSESLWPRPARKSVHRFLIALIVAAHGTVHAQEGEVRWRVFDQVDTVLLVIADSDATDNLGSPLFECKKASGMATAEGDMSDDMRSIVAAQMIDDEAANIDLMPSDSSARNFSFLFSYMTGWRYRFDLSVTGPAFEQLKRIGSFEFRVADTVVRKEFKENLESVAKFQELCKSQLK
jgi:hypothetical protein